MLRWLDELANGGIFTTDSDLVVRSWNQWLQRHTGLEVSQVVGRPLFELYPELPARGLDRYYGAALAGEASLLAQSLHRHLLTIPNKADPAGAPMPQSARIAPLMHEGQIIGTVTVIDDVGERVMGEAE